MRTLLLILLSIQALVLSAQDSIYVVENPIFLVHQDFEEPVTGLNAFPKEDRPRQVNAVFQFYHIW